MTDDERWAFDVAMKILDEAGEEESLSLDGFDCTVETYEDPWGAGLVIRRGGADDSITKRLTVQNENGEYLMTVKFVGRTPIQLQTFDTTTAWTLYLSACLADVEDS